MDSEKHQPGDGFTQIQRLTPGKVDIVLGAHPSRRKVVQRTKRTPYIWIVFALLFVGLGAYAMNLRSKTSPPTPKPFSEQPLPVAVEPEPAAVETPRAVTSVKLAEPVIETKVVSQERPAAVLPLDACMKNGNVIDENVLNCRFGQVPRATEREPAKGMVSAHYMADFKSDISRPHAERQKPFSIVSVSFRAIDSRSRYHADFRMFNNHIENSSVCMNFSKGSAENRECRRAAVVFFKEACLDWSKRASKDRDEQSQLTRDRYCEANRTFEAG